MEEKRITGADVRRSAMDLLARREHGVDELRRKLHRRYARRLLDAGLIDEALERLVSEDLLSDTRFAESLTRQMIERGMGPRRIVQELQARGVDAELDSVLERAQIDVDWFDQAFTVYKKKYRDEPLHRDEPEATFKERGRRARFMQYRGFEAEHFMSLLDVD
ncbi:regulatory protein RecX [Luminiphilus syltensis NOR5-1B]|uniref:Regulatory protein RecX n=1 Tax=Luminiphilus syltensis NOR5-1B TaxID=565045 RepID=B8KSF0_9GAMM|nr:regulatory protein RecX [Luminiphilus syltensis]EED35603.1 regulatory protein RecX [Luminiphilus syltensis NOR5-1B]